MAEQNNTPKPQETEENEVQAHSADDVLALQKLDPEDKAKGGVIDQAFSCSSCAAASC